MKDLRRLLIVVPAVVGYSLASWAFDVSGALIVFLLGVVSLPVTLGLHVLEYLFVGRALIRHGAVVLVVLFVLAVGGYVVLLWKIMKLDVQRLAVLAGVNVVLYLFILWYLVSRAMLF